MLDVQFADPAPLAPARAAADAGAVDGYVEVCGRSDDAGGWLVGGWARCRWSEHSRDVVSLCFSGGALAGRARACFFPRGDLRQDCVGFLLILRGPGTATGRLLEMTVTLGDQSMRLRPAVATLPVASDQLPAAAAQLAQGMEARARLRSWLHAPRYTGVDTLTRPGRSLRLEIEASLLAPPAGLALLGWLDDPAASVTALHVRSADRLMELDETSWWRIPRQDVLAGLAEEITDGGPDRGFVAFLPDVLQPGEAPCLQIEFSDGEVAYKPIPPPATAGLAALRRLLSAIHLSHGALGGAMDRVVGPAVEALNAARLQLPPGQRALRFASPAQLPRPGPPRCSVIVHLDGPADELEWQLALLSEAAHEDVEFLYVQDLPGLAGEVERRAATCPARFGLALRLLLLERAVGRGPCWTLAAQHAAGHLLCFLDRRAIPDDPAWLDRLLTGLEDDPGLGALSGSLRTAGTPATASVALAGARGTCLVLRRALFAELGGFDPAFALGELEDEDLLHRLRTRGLPCRVREDVTLTLLDRAPGPTPMWRRNLTLYNAWLWDRHWPAAAG